MHRRRESHTHTPQCLTLLGSAAIWQAAPRATPAGSSSQCNQLAQLEILVAGIASPKCGQVSFLYGMSSAWEETYILSPSMGDEGKTGSFFWLCLSLWPPHTGFLLLLHWDLLCYYQVKQQFLNAKMYTVCSLVYNGLTVSPFVCLGHKQHSWKKMPQNLPHWPFLSKTWKPLLIKLKQIRQEEEEERSWSNNSNFGCISISVL